MSSSLGSQDFPAIVKSKAAAAAVCPGTDMMGTSQSLEQYVEARLWMDMAHPQRMSKADCLLPLAGYCAEDLVAQIHAAFCQYWNCYA